MTPEFLVVPFVVDLVVTHTKRTHIIFSGHMCPHALAKHGTL